MNSFEVSEKLGYNVLFIPHDEIKEYIACYRVIYRNKEIYPGAALRLGIPVNEIWISDAYQDFAKYILFHELREIQHRYEGHEPDEAHEMALKDEEMEFRDDPKWRRMKMEINICTLEELMNTRGIGEELALRIMGNRPYDSMDDLLKVEGIGKKRLMDLKKRFWCVLEQLIPNHRNFDNS